MENSEKSQGQLLEESFLLKPKSVAELLGETEIEKSTEFAVGYKTYLDQSKTERAAVKTTVAMLEKSGYKPFDSSKKYKAGDKVYLNNRGKSLLYAVLGTQPLEDGVRIIASHIDSPRIDLRQRPLYQDTDMAFFKTQYYGGVRKYQWVTIPLSLYGTVSLKDGSTVDIVIGEDDTDPIFMINDLLPHLSQDQNKRTLSEGIKGEELNVFVGSLPYNDDKVSEKVKLNILTILNEKYGIIEADFFSADLSLVPSVKARDLGLDRSMIASYGQDDRVCAYPSVMATLEVNAPKTTFINVLADKEEVGSMGNTGLRSHMLSNFVDNISRPYGIPGHVVLERSQCLSADVMVGLDPTFGDVSEPRNAARMGFGVCLVKYTGGGGKGGTSEASAEYSGRIRRLLDKNEVVWQTGELGRVDLGGGGTVAQFIADLGVDVIDIGVPTLSMHAPYEVVSKLDVLQTYKAYLAFLSE